MSFEECAEELRKELRRVFEIMAGELRIPVLIEWIDEKLTKRGR